MGLLSTLSASSRAVAVGVGFGWFAFRNGASASEILAAVKGGYRQAYERNIWDGIRQELSGITADALNDALAIADMGNMAPYARIRHHLTRGHAFTAGVRDQLKAGVKRVDQDVLPTVSGNELARQVADRTRARWWDAHPSREEGIDGGLEAIFQGGGLVEVLWSTEQFGPYKGERYWTGFVPVPHERIRFNPDTGEQEIAMNANDARGIPVSAFPPGTFVQFLPDRHIPQFSFRGIDRAVVGVWHRYQNADAWWSQTAQNFGTPFVHATYEDDQDEPKLKRVVEEMGPNSRLLTRKGAEVKFTERTAGQSPHGEWIRALERQITIRYLGASQTVTIEPESGSKQSVGVHAEVRQDKLREIWAYLREGFERDLFRVFTILNWGLENAYLAPQLFPQFREDTATVLDNLAKAKALGLEPSEDAAFELLPWQKPGPQERRMGESRDAQPAATAFPRAA